MRNEVLSNAGSTSNLERDSVMGLSNRVESSSIHLCDVANEILNRLQGSRPEEPKNAVAYCGGAVGTLQVASGKLNELDVLLNMILDEVGR